MIRKYIPNFITSLAIISGSLAVMLAVEGNLTGAVIFIFFAAIFDFLDGFAARLLKAYSELGKQLDSLSDMISFGLAPGAIMLSLQKMIVLGNNTALSNIDINFPDILFLLSAFAIPVFSAIRLAKFNIDKRQSTSFIGLPTPASAIFFASLALIYEHGQTESIDSLLLSPILLTILSITISFLMVSELPMFSFKFSNFSWRDNKVRFVFVALAILLISLGGIYGITATIIAYILLSVAVRNKA
jgi:CDP-diacylglycerol--serine O-phosphatidyltransferase